MKTTNMVLSQIIKRNSMRISLIIYFSKRCLYFPTRELIITNTFYLNSALIYFWSTLNTLWSFVILPITIFLKNR